MKNLLIIAFVVLASQSALAQWVKQTVNTTASLRGLSVVNEKIIWASGTGGTVIKTIDGGSSWKVMTVPGAAQLDLRDIEAFGADTAYALSIGGGKDSRIYKTADGGTTWKLQFTNQDLVAFYDALACWDENNCLAMSDPVKERFVLLSTTNGGSTWQPVDTSKMPTTTLSEAAFAASGTCLIAHGTNGAFLVSGGGNARVFRSSDRGRTWNVADSPIVKGRPGTGIFSIAMIDAMNGVIVGGEYDKPADTTNNLAFTRDGGKTWTKGTGLSGYRSGVAYIDKKTLVAVGTNGSDISRDGGKSWKQIDKGDYNSVQAKGKKAVWAVGPKGMIAKMK
jgi:photosystem II stability/assembly factor-like uncharacterized protein